MDRDYVESGFGTMGRSARRKLRNDNDVKFLVVGQNSQTGIGKTTFAIQLAKSLDLTETGWTAKEKAFNNVRKYVVAHQNKPKQSCLLLDEIEAGADSRRAMSHENVQLSQAWATMRAKNIATVATLPSVSMLDNRMLEMADYWVLVKQRGLAQPYRVEVNDFNGKVRRVPIREGEHIRFNDLETGDEDKKYLDDIKDSLVMNLASTGEKIDPEEHEKKVENEREKSRLKVRNKAVYDLYKSSELSLSDIGDLEWVDLSHQQVSNIVNEQKTA